MVLACIVGCGVAADIRGIPAGVVTGCLQRTLFAAPAWMRGAILPCAPQATLQPNHTLPLFLAGVSESDTPYIPGKSSWGTNLARRGACGLAALRPNFFCRGGGGGAQGNAAHTHPPRPCAQAFCRSPPPAGTQSILLLPHFCQRLSAMAGMTKALQVATVREYRPVSAVRLDVVHFRGRCPDSTPGTFPAKRLTKELSGPQVLRPLWSQVHPVPGLGRITAAVLGAVEITIAASYQGRTPRMSAWTQRLLCHGLSPPGKTKSRHRRLLHRKIIGTGLSESTGHVRYSRDILPCNYGTRESSGWRWSQSWPSGS